MAEKRRERIINNLGRLAMNSAIGTEVTDMLGYLGKEFNLSYAFVLEIKEIPMFLELGDYWEREPLLSEQGALIDYRENPDWELINPYDEKKRTIVISDTAHCKMNALSREFTESVGIRAMVGSAIISDNDYLGVVLFGVRGAVREWTEEEVDILKLIGPMIYKYVLQQKRAAVQKYLSDESAKFADVAQTARNNFVVSVSREIRTPVSALIGINSILSHNIDKPDVVAQCVDRMEKTSKQLLDSLNSCLSESVQSSAAEDVEKIRFKPSEVIEDAIGSIRSLAQGMKQQVITEALNDDYVFGDKRRLTDILTTLITNACKYSDIGMSVSVSTRLTDVGVHKMLIMTVKDNGQGIKPEIVRHIFDPASEGRVTSKENAAGIGLMLVKHFTDILGGTLEISSEDGHGSSVTVNVPVEEINRKVEEPEEENDEVISELYIGRRILIAEDNVMMGEILATLLGYRGLETEIAGNGEEAVKMFNEHDQFYYDMIFMDIQMPVMDGIAAAKAIRSSDHADAGMIPIIALSANGFEEDVNKSLSAGMNAHMTKPVGERELFEVISGYLI